MGFNSLAGRFEILQSPRAAESHAGAPQWDLPGSPPRNGGFDLPRAPIFVEIFGLREIRVVLVLLVGHLASVGPQLAGG